MVDVPLTADAIQAAPVHPVPTKEFIGVEHPCIIKNLDKCEASLGGERGISRLLPISEDEKPVGKLYLHPEDSSYKPLRSANVATQNLLLKITVPKSKRRCNRVNGMENENDGDRLEPVGHDRADDSTRSQVGNAHRLFRSLRDNSEKYRIEVMGSITQTHRFRGLPDFVMSAENSPFLRKVQATLGTTSLKEILKFEMKHSEGIVPNDEIIPPPRFTTNGVPFYYAYNQGPGIKRTTDAEGNTVMLNTSKIPKIYAQPVPYDVAVVPAGPPPELPPLETLDPALQALVHSALHMLEDRPIYTRRALSNSMPGNDWHDTGPNTTKFLFQYIGYIFASGPWRDALVKFGVDPRTDARYRHYQTMMFMIEPDSATTQQSSTLASNKSTKTRSVSQGPAQSNQAHTVGAQMTRTSHCFDGSHVELDGKVWQVCDITDPILADILSTCNLRSECHIAAEGWYHNGTWAKAKQIMKSKITALLSRDDTLTDFNYARVARDIPDVIVRAEKAGTGIIKLAFQDVMPEERALASSIRSASMPYSRRTTTLEKTTSSVTETLDMFTSEDKQHRNDTRTEDELGLGRDGIYEESEGDDREPALSERKRKQNEIFSIDDDVLDPALR